MDSLSILSYVFTEAVVQHEMPVSRIVCLGSYLGAWILVPCYCITSSFLGKVKLFSSGQRSTFSTTLFLAAPA